MQRTNGNSTVTTTTLVGVTPALVIVGANVVRCASFSMPADSKRSDSKPGDAQRMREHAGWRHHGQQPRDAAATLRAAESYRPSSVSLLPPRVWASWVLSQSLCG